jgi:hypothetical protein
MVKNVGKPTTSSVRPQADVQRAHAEPERPLTPAPRRTTAEAPPLRSGGTAPDLTSVAHGARTIAPGAMSLVGARLTTAATDGADAADATDAARFDLPATLPIEDGARAIVDRATFDALSKRDDVPGALGVREVKFLIADADTDDPQLYFINTENHPYHYFFTRDALGVDLDNREFNNQTYFTDDRKFMAGTLVAHDHYASTADDGTTTSGMYSMEFWPTDPVRHAHVAKAFDLIAENLPFAKDKLRYHPSGETQRAIFEQEKDELAAAGVDSISTTELFGSLKYSPLNLGEGYGVLRYVDGTDPKPPSVRDVVIFKSIPNDLSHVAGVITEEPQTPLSHVNLKAKQNDTPNAYIKDAANDPNIAPLIGKMVHYKVTPDGYEITEADPAKAQEWLDAVRPATAQSPERDLTVTDIARLDDMGHADVSAFGAKAANVAELRQILPAGMVPDGAAVPFAFYDELMKANGLYDEAAQMMADPAFKADPAVREAKLKKLRKKIKKATVPPALSAKIKALQDSFPATQPLRCRSSTNNEDLEGFNGAGLYDSKTHRPDEGHLENTLKQVWASLWNYRAFEERDFYRIDHFSAAMGVLVHPNFDDEKANGVAVTKNIYDPNWEGYYVNVQVGESLVTNPDPSATPDELLISAIGQNREFETQYIRSSSLTTDGGHVMSDEHLAELTSAMKTIQAHFKQVYGAQLDRDFAMDIEFKVDDAGKLVVKQARPWVD